MARKQDSGVGKYEKGKKEKLRFFVLGGMATNYFHKSTVTEY